MEPHGGRAGATVEREDDGTFGRVGDLVACIGDEEERRLLLAFLLSEEEASRRGRVVERLPADRGAMGAFGEVLLEVRVG